MTEADFNAKAQEVRQIFRNYFGGEAAVLVRSPGRVNLIGEHTDYNEGFVLPAAVDRAMVLAVSPRADDRCRIRAVDLGESADFPVHDPPRDPRRWPDYLAGVVVELRHRGLPVSGFDCGFGSTIPIGAGMSSSAALCAGLAFALNHLFGLGLDRPELARLAQRAENEFVGVNCGIMDPFINLHGQADTALLLDCRTLAWEAAPLTRPDLRIVLCDTRVRRELAASEYNQRRRQCEAGVVAIHRRFPGVSSLRDVTPAMLTEAAGDLDPVVRRRCHFVISENARVHQTVAALRAGDWPTVRSLLAASHAGLRDDYDVSCPELNVLAEAAQGLSGVWGSRMMGGGFGGCTIHLVEAAAGDDFRTAMVQRYTSRFGREPGIYECRVAAGTEIMKI
ncbi:MAG: galactokinase [Acidobacteria bacterium]|nr:galactokinase [Acidobacteriota bacterium]